MAIGQACDLSEVLRVDAFAIARLRRLFRSGYDALTLKERGDLAAGGVGVRLRLLHREMGFILSDEQFGWWLWHVNLSEREVWLLEAGYYHIWPGLLMRYVELFDIEYTFLASGGSPYGETNMQRHTVGHRGSRRARRGGTHL